MTNDQEKLNSFLLWWDKQQESASYASVLQRATDYNESKRAYYAGYDAKSAERLDGGGGGF